MILRSLSFGIVISTIGFAQSADFGIQAQIAIPGGDLQSQVGSDSAIGLGMQVRWGLRGGHAIVARIDRVEFSGSRNFDFYDPDGYGSVSRDAKQVITSLGADYNYYFSRRVGQGFYLGGGLGLLQKDESYASGRNYYFRDESNQNKTRIYADFNMGVALNRHVSLYSRALLFGDERQADTYYGSTGNYQASYTMSLIITFGAEFHF